jgi:hypothetical protein
MVPGSVLIAAGAVGLLIVVGAVVLLDHRSGSPGTSATAAATAKGPSALASSRTDCLVRRWSVPADQEFAQMGLDRLTGGAVEATGGMIRVVFAADHRYTFTYDRVRLNVGAGAGSATVDGPVTGAWELTGNRLTTTVGSSKIAVRLEVAGVLVTPTQGLNDALKNGMPGAAEVSCSPDRLVATVVTGAAAGQQVVFGPDRS